MLFEVHSDQGDEFQFDLYLSRAAGAVEGGSGGAVCELRVPGLL